MTVVGITGTIGSGKSAVGQRLQQLGAQYIDVDKYVHNTLYTQSKIVDKIRDKFPEVMLDKGQTDRTLLGDIVFNDGNKLKQLEAILHPEVEQYIQSLIQKHIDTKMLILDIPLLYEAGLDKYCDYVIVITADDDVRYQRVSERSGMSKEKYTAIKAKQDPEEDKISRADEVIDTTATKAGVYDLVDKLYDRLKRIK